jgi:OmcA/MtrC family decaheme c-type cytochrome
MKNHHTFGIPFALLLALLIGGCGSNKGSAPEGAAAPGASLALQSQILGVTVASPPVVTFTLSDEVGVPLVPTGSSTPGPGQARVRFTIARIGADGNYVNYIRSSTATQPTYDSGGTFATVGTGTYTYTFKTDIDNAAQTLGGIVVTGNRDRTHTVAAQMQRTVTDNTNLVPSARSFVQAANPYLNFRPDGGAVTVTREIVPTSACNECHGLLGFHGGARREVALCILCHYPGVFDPSTATTTFPAGNSVDMKSLIHKIHMGKNLPSNKAGGDYTIIGNAGSVHGYETVGYPTFSTDNTVTQTPVDCVRCHKAGTDLVGKAAGRDADKWKAEPTINKCTTCHDTVTFDGSATIVVKSRQPDNAIVDNTVAAILHTGGVIPTGADNTVICSLCHASGVIGVDEFNDTVVGAHTVVENSSRNPGVNFQILAVDNATAGNSPRVTFKVTLDNGTAVVPSATANVTSFSLRMGYTRAGSIDFSNDLLFDNVTATRPGQPTSFSLTGSAAAVNRLVNNGDGSFTAAFVLDNDVLPASATGIGVISMEGRLGLIGAAITTPHKGTRTNSTIRFSGEASQWFFDLATGARVIDPLQTRRVQALTSKCNVCHNVVRLHGGSRINVEECVLCHNPNATDRGQRPGITADNLVEQTIDFKVMIHKIHSGEQLSQKPYIIYGNNQSVNDFAEVRYPRDRRDCLACHADENPPVFGLPLRAGIQGTSVGTGAVINNNSADDTKIGPTRAVCTTCHDDTTAVLPHVLNQTVSATSELCASCHATGLTFGPDRVHRPGRPGTFPTE